jgi:hypothetical protein
VYELQQVPRGGHQAESKEDQGVPGSLDGPLVKGAIITAACPAATLGAMFSSKFQVGQNTVPAEIPPSNISGIATMAFWIFVTEQMGETRARAIRGAGAAGFAWRDGYLASFSPTFIAACYGSCFEVEMLLYRRMRRADRLDRILPLYGLAEHSRRSTSPRGIRIRPH